MAQNKLQKLFQDKKKKAKPANINWAARRDSWIKAVNRLYQTIEHDYLNAAKSEVEITHPDKVVTENQIGEYHIPELNLRVGDEQVLFSPKGTNLIGLPGRIDVVGECGEATMIWQKDDHWSFVLARTPRLLLVPLTADSLAEMLRGIMRP